MISVYVTSSFANAGKTSAIAAIASILQEHHLEIAYFKPIINQVGPVTADNDTALISRYFNLGENPDTIRTVYSDEDALLGGIKDVCKVLCTGKDILFIEGIPGNIKLARDISEIIDAAVIGVEVYRTDYQEIQNQHESVKNHAGIIFNKIPQSRLSITKENIMSCGMKILGMVPEERTLISLTVKELADNLDGKLISVEERSTDMITNFMIGAMTPTHGSEYYNIKKDKAVIINSERPDMQLAALETPTRCLVLTGVKQVSSIVLRQAEAKKVPVITVDDTINNIVKKIEEMITCRYLNTERLNRTIAVFKKYMDTESLLSGLSIR